MAISRCPGQDKRYWKSEDVFESPCPYCGASVEFWKSEPRRRCTHCGKGLLNPKLDLGCAKWCKFAGDCLGITPAGSKEDSLCEGLIREMKAVFGDDQKRIRHALEVLDFAETILLGERGRQAPDEKHALGVPVDPMVVKAAAVLHDIGIHEAQRKHGSAAGRYQEMEGPPIARAILAKFDVDAERTAHILRIVGSHHSPEKIDTEEFRIVWDADRLANIPEECAGKDRPALERFIEHNYQTETGRGLAAGKLLALERP